MKGRNAKPRGYWLRKENQRRFFQEFAALMGLSSGSSRIEQSYENYDIRKNGMCHYVFWVPVVLKVYIRVTRG